MGGFNFGNILPVNVLKCHREKILFSDNKKLSKTFNFYYLHSSPYPCITDIVEAWNTLIEKRHNHSESCVTVKKSRRTQKVETYLEVEGSGLAFPCTRLGHIFGSNVCN